MPFPAHARRSCSLALLLAAAAAPLVRSAPCVITAKTVVAVYADTEGGVGPGSNEWTRAFFSWWRDGDASPDLEVAFVSRAAQLSACPPLASFPNLLLWVQPGGDAAEQAAALGPLGRDNVLDYAASAQGHVYATCAGFYFSAGAYWWYGKFEGQAWMPHWLPTLEGPVVAIAAYPDHARTVLSNGLAVVYYGGPTLGLNLTTSHLPARAEVLAFYDHPGVPKDAPAIVRYKGPYVDGLFVSPHPEATWDGSAGGDITQAEQVRNWQWLARELNGLMGTHFLIPI